MTSTVVDWGGNGDFEDDGYYDEEFQSQEVEEYGCLYGEKCCMPGLHFVGECHTKEAFEDQERLAQFKEIKQLYKDAGWVKLEHTAWMVKVLSELLE